MNSAAKQLIDKRVVIKFHLLRTGSKWVRAQRGSGSGSELRGVVG